VPLLTEEIIELPQLAQSDIQKRPIMPSPE